MGFVKLLSGAVTGIEAFPVDIEADVSNMGDPQMVIVGLPDASVRESQHRVSTAISNSGHSLPRGRMTVNLAPADVRKDGSLFDLPIAVALLLADGQASERQARQRPGDPAQSPLPPLDSSTTALVGELSLGGDVRPVRGVLPLAVSLRERGVRSFIVPAENAAEAAVVEGLDVYPVSSLRDAVETYTGETGRRKQPLRSGFSGINAASAKAPISDFVDVKGQEMAKRALEVAVAGGHNILMVGPPGTGKSMLARRIPSILPELTLPEALEATKIHSIAGLLPPGSALLRERPFRSPHHTVSNVGLIGGGAHPAPGEVTLAHLGVLFLDELPEFNRSVLEVLRQPMEDGFVTISRAAGSARFPSRFMLVAAMNPCPCGYYGDPNRPCRCSRTQIQNYRAKISGPLLDRIDLHIQVPGIRPQDLQSIPSGKTSAEMQGEVVRARRVQAARFATNQSGGVQTNASMSRRDIERYCRMNGECLQVMNFAMGDMHLSPRAHDRILKVARTIADLAGHEDLAPEDLQEAISYRSLDRSLWT